MQLLFMNQWLPAGLMKAICWTLIHSLWQGLILAALAGLMMMLTKKQTAAFRYNMLAVLFLVFMSVATGTFMVELNTTAAAGVENLAFVGKTVTPVQHEALLPLGTSLEVNNGEAYIEKFTGYFNEHATLLVTIWFIIFLAKALKLVSGLAYIQRVRNYKVQQPAVFWRNRIKELATVLGVQMPVQLLESGLVTVPMVTGILKPIILVPAGLMINLPHDQIEAILLHELAHIRRRDFLVNLAQSFAEILFFFNPAVLWLSSLLREEREHCCDDMAIGITQSKKQYVHALVSFQEYQLENNTPYAMTFPGKKNQLLNRVKRIVNNSNKTLNLTEKTFLVVCIGLILLLSMVVTRPAVAQEPPSQQEQQVPDIPGQEVMAAPDDTGVPAQLRSGPDKQVAEASRAATDITGAEDLSSDPDTFSSAAIYDAYQAAYQEKIAQGNKITYIHPYIPVNATYQAMPVAPVSVKANDMEPNTPANQLKQATLTNTAATDTLPVLHKGNSIMSGIMTVTRDGKEYKMVLDQNRLVGLIVDGKAVIDQALPNYYDEVNAILRSVERDARQAQVEKQREQAEIDRRKAEENRLHLDRQLQFQKVQLGAQAPLSGRMHTPGKLTVGPKDSLLRTEPIKTKTTVIDEIITDLQVSALVTSTNPLSFRITKDEVVINNVVQPKPVQEYFQNKYVKSPVDTYSYSKEGGRTSRTVQIDR